MSSRERPRVVPAGLTGLAGVACAACCLIPPLLAVGVLGGAGWAAAGRVLPGVAVALVAAAGLAWWRLARQRPAHGCDGGCAGGEGGPCPDPAGTVPAGRVSVPSPP